MTTLTKLTALSPLDGRYHGKVDALRAYFSEFGLIRYRVLIEIEWLKALRAQPDIAGVAPFSAATVAQLDALNENFCEDDALAIKTIEATTNHDVKAVEYWLRDKLSGNPETAEVLEFIHFACTSEDINNLSHALMLKTARDAVMLPDAERADRAGCKSIAHQHAELPMLCRTHGQTATPSTLGKEMANVVYRLQRAERARGRHRNTRQDQRRGGQLQCAPGGLSRRRLGRFRGTLCQRARPDVQPVHHPDRTARLHG